MNLARAIVLADKIREQLQPMCDKIALAGSIRRSRPEVNDIDFVILPKPGQLQAIKQRCKQNCRAITDGDQNFICALRLSPGNEFQLDIFFARHPVKELLQIIPGNFGSLLLCRTGSKEHNIYLIEHAKRRGLTWNPYQGVFDSEGYCIASETEEAIFDALNLDPVPPERRER